MRTNSENCTFVIVHQSLDFHSEIQWPGQVDIGSKIVSMGNSSITFEHALFRDNRCVASARVVVVQINDKTKKSQPLTPGARDYLSGFAA